MTQSFSNKALVLAAAVAACGSLVQCTSSKPRAEIVVSVKDQRMGLYSEGHLKKKYVISTSKFGLGDRPGSNCTPLGKHEIIAKIGHGLPAGAVLKSRHWNGEVIKPNAPGRDPIVSRIMWLKGMESSNRNAMGRFIYIHGTPEEARLGTPASYGCIRMGMKDVIKLFDEAGIGAKVVITKNSLPHAKEDKSIEETPIDGEAPATPAEKATTPDKPSVPEAKATALHPIASVTSVKEKNAETESGKIKAKQKEIKGEADAETKAADATPVKPASFTKRLFRKELAHS